MRATRMRKILCDIRCITYSLSLFGWKYSCSGKENSACLCHDIDLQLAVGVGTVTNQILIWSVLDTNDCASIVQDFYQRLDNEEGKLKRKVVSHTLSGHEGVIYSCKFGDNGEFIASTSDDRTIRLWKKHWGHSSPFNVNKSDMETSGLVKNIIDNENNYELLWTGFGHTCRVFDCSFILLPLLRTFGVVTSGEDGEISFSLQLNNM